MELLPAINYLGLSQALQIPTSRSMKSASRLAEDHAIVRREMTVDPFLEELFKLRKISCAPGSLRQDLSGDMPLVTRPNAKIYDQMEANVAQCFAGFPGLHHKVLMTALSDWTTTIAPEMVHEVLHLTLNSKVLENIGTNPDSEWPEKNADAIRMLSGVTVLWTSFLNTKTWTLHPVNLPPEAMTGRVLSAAARSMYWSPQGAVWGMVGTFRRYIDGRLKALGRHCSNQRQAVLSVPCLFNLFAFLVIATRNAQCFPLNPPRPPVGLSLPPTPTPFPSPSILLSEGRGLLIGLVILCSSTVPSLQIVDPSTRTVDSVSSTIFPCSALLNLPLGLRNKGTLCK